MDITGAVIGGVLGTLAMLGFFLASPTRAGMFKLDVAGYVGLLFTASPKLARWIGLAVLSFNGAVLAVISAFLWDRGIGHATWGWGLVFGAVLGGLSLIVMVVLERIHPRPGEADLASESALAVILWLGHLVYGLVTVLVYNAF